MGFLLLSGDSADVRKVVIFFLFVIQSFRPPFFHCTAVRIHISERSVFLISKQKILPAVDIIELESVFVPLKTRPMTVSCVEMFFCPFSGGKWIIDELHSETCSQHPDKQAACQHASSEC